MRISKNGSQLFLRFILIVMTSLTFALPGLNIALKKKAYSSDAYTIYTADKAVDGIADFHFSPNCIHGTKHAKWVVVDLDGPYRIGKVEITSTNYYAKSLDYIVVGLSNSYEPNTPPDYSSYIICGQYPSSATEKSKLIIECPMNIPPKRYVIVHQPGNGSGFLTLCEIEVFQQLDIDINPFLGCFEYFKDEIKIDNSLTKDQLNCDGYCRFNNRTYFSVEEDNCLCGNIPIHAGICGEQNMKVYAVCPIGFYGTQCNQMCNCQNGMPCDVDLGICPGECLQHWKGLNCNKANYTVQDLFVGCIQEMNEFKKSFLFPNQNCFESCKMRGFDFAGMRRELCWCFHVPLDMKEYCGESKFIDIYTVCPKGTYGYDCSQTCFCQNGNQCSYTTGKCHNGCVLGWKGASCNVRDCSFSNGLCKDNSRCLAQQNTSICTCDEGFSSLNINSKCEVRYASNDYSLVIGVISGLILLVIFIMLIIIFHFKFRNKFREYLKIKENKRIIYSKQVCLLEDANEVSEVSNDNLVEGKLKLDQFPGYVATNSQSFADEFKSIPLQGPSSCSYGLQKQLKHKNRFRNIVPYDSNRVILKQLLDNEESDYINASYITGCSKTIMIACQGPTNQSVHDFWRMIGEQEVGMIVMLCNLQENNKNKCTKYWPTISGVSYGGYKIQLETVRRWRGFNERKFLLETPKSLQRPVLQLHYTNWPDHGVPDDILNFLAFRKRFRILLNEKKCTTVVHCSAGVGRTGCFLAVDWLLERSSRDEYLDIPGCVRMLRMERANMVQTLSQYEFIYNTLVVKASMGDTFYRMDEYLEYYRLAQNDPKATDHLMNQFEMVLQNHSFKDCSSVKRRDPINFKSSSGNLKFTITSKCNLLDITEMLFSRCNNVIAFDPLQIILSIFTNTTVEVDNNRSLTLKEIVETNFGTRIIIERTFQQNDFHGQHSTNKRHHDKQLLINVLDECLYDSYVQFNRMLQLYKNVVKINVEYGQDVFVFNLSESDSAGIFVAFSCISELIDLRGEVAIYDHVVDLNTQANTLLVKTLNSFQDLHNYAFNYLLLEEK